MRLNRGFGDIKQNIIGVNGESLFDFSFKNTFTAGAATKTSNRGI